jgi:hypothetical protein
MRDSVAKYNWVKHERILRTKRSASVLKIVISPATLVSQICKRYKPAKVLEITYLHAKR